MGVILRGMACHLPETPLTNEDLCRENPDWDMRQVEQLSGIATRYVARENETSLDLAVRACEKLFAQFPELRGGLDGVLFCTQSPDYLMPPNACLLHERLELAESVFALDLNAACSGFVYGLAVGRGLVASGMLSNVLLVNADTYSKFIHKKDRATRSLFSDGAAATWLAAGEAGLRLLDIECATSGKYHESCMIPAGGFRLPKSGATAVPAADASGNIRTAEDLRMDGMAILGFVNSRVPAQIRRLLDRNGLAAEDIDLFVFHQASKMALECLVRILGIPPERAFTNLRDIGNTVSASIPIALKQALDSGRARPGAKIVLSGFGAGLSWASALLER